MGAETVETNDIPATQHVGFIMLEADAANIEHKVKQIRQAVRTADAAQALKLLEILRLQLAQPVYHAAQIVKETGGEPLVILRDDWYGYLQPHRGDWLPTFNTTDEALYGDESRKQAVNAMVVQALFHLYSPAEDEEGRVLDRALFKVDREALEDERDAAAEVEDESED